MDDTCFSTNSSGSINIAMAIYGEIEKNEHIINTLIIGFQFSLQSSGNSFSLIFDEGQTAIFYNVRSKAKSKISMYVVMVILALVGRIKWLVLTEVAIWRLGYLSGSS